MMTLRVNEQGVEAVNVKKSMTQIVNDVLFALSSMVYLSYHYSHALTHHSQSKVEAKKSAATILSKGWSGLKLQDLMHFDEKLAERYKHTLH
jgi:hypothetical protein